ncbi:MAG: TetR/AcrR family transcriptional regulator [Planctomycetota bacterium]|jgi:AcrR family transcriptional regulator
MTAPLKTAAELFAEIPAPRDTREKILFMALDLFHMHGFHAVGLDRILTEVGVTKTTFYNHFESRDDLIVQAITTRDEWDAAAFARRVQEKAGYAPRDMLLAMFDVLDEWFTHDDFRGCIFLHACAEFPSQKDPVHRAAAKHYAVSQQTVAQMAEAAGASDPQAFAREWAVLLQGAITQRMATGDDQAAQTAKRIAVRVLEAAVPAT